jgi:hypothetical protein
MTNNHPATSAMVSYPESVDRTGPVQPAPSTSSRISISSRRHRHSRSHHGGSSRQLQNDFPIFSHTGDMEIVITVGKQERRYLLHRLILAQCSGFFEASTSEEWSRSQARGETQPVAGSSGLERGPSDIQEDGIQSLDSESTLLGNWDVSAPVVKKRWRYELDWENQGEDEEPILVQKVCRYLLHTSKSISVKLT